MKNKDVLGKQPSNEVANNQAVRGDLAQPKNKQSAANPNTANSGKHKTKFSSLIKRPVEFHKRHTEEPAVPEHKETFPEEIGGEIRQTYDALESLLKKHPQLRVIIAVLAVGILLAIGIGVVSYKSEPKALATHMQIAGVSVDNLDESAALKKLNNTVAAQQITIGIDGNNYTFSSKDLGITRDVSNLVEYSYSKPQSKIEQLFVKQQKFTNIKTYINQTKLIAAIESKLGQYKQTVDASLSIDGGTVVVNSSKAGMNIDFDKITSQLDSSKINQNVTIKASLTITEPTIDTAAANAAKVQADNLISKSYAVTSSTNVTKYASTAQKASWLRFTSNANTKSISVAMNTDAAKSTLTQLANSFAQGERDKVVLTFDGAAPTLIDSGQDGVAVDQNSLNAGLAQLTNAVNNNQSFSFPIALLDQPAGERDLGGINGGKFVLVDIANLKAYAVNNNTVDRVMLVSTGIPSMPTHRGSFKVLAKTRLKTMTGCNEAVGCWDVPNVPNVQFFTSDGEALHGTYWHHEFGIKNMSHGCVNLSLDDAAWLYDWTVIGTDVIVV